MSQVSEPHPAKTPINTSSAPTARSTTVSSVLIWLGVALFTLGLLSIIVTFAVPLAGWRLSWMFYYLAMLAPAGMIIGVVGALASGRRARN